MANSSWHGGKGSKPRPISNQKQFDSNWDRIFGNRGRDNSIEGGFWEHNCKHNGRLMIGKGEQCSWCGNEEP